VRLCEVDFASAPDDVKEDLMEYARGLWSTLPNEFTGNMWRDAQRHDKAQKLGPEMAWFRSYVKDQMLECGRAMVPRSAEAKAEIPNPPKASCTIDSSEECSLPADVLNSIHSRDPDWPNVCPDALKQSALHWQNLVDSKGDSTVMDKAYASLLAPPGAILLAENGAMLGMAIFCSPEGLLMASCVAGKKCSAVTVDVRLRDWNDLWYFVIRDPRSLRGTKARLAAPYEMEANGYKTDTPQVIVVSKSMPLLELAAADGFSLFNTAGLKKLHLSLEDPDADFARPKTDEQTFKALCKLIYKDRFDTEWEI